MVNAEGGDKTRLNWLMLGRVDPELKDEAEALGMMNLRAFTSGVWVFLSFVSTAIMVLQSSHVGLSCTLLLPLLLLLQGGALW